MSDERILKAALAYIATHDEWEKTTQHEIELLRAKKLKDAGAIIKGKGALTDLYQSQLKFLTENREQLSALPDDLKEKLRYTQTSFDKLSVIYQRELELAFKSAERLMKLIQGAITQQRTTSQFYGRSGALNAPEAPRSVAINKKA